MEGPDQFFFVLEGHGSGGGLHLRASEIPHGGLEYSWIVTFMSLLEKSDRYRNTVLSLLHFMIDYEVSGDFDGY